MFRRETGKFLSWSHHPQRQTLLCAHMCPRNRILQQKRVMADFGIAQCPWSDKSLNLDKFLSKIFNSFFSCQRICQCCFHAKISECQSTISWRFSEIKNISIKLWPSGGDFFGKSKSHISPRLVFILRGRSTQRTEQEQQLCRSFVRVWLGNTCNAQTDPEFSFFMLCWIISD